MILSCSATFMVALSNSQTPVVSYSRSSSLLIRPLIFSLQLCATSNNHENSLAETLWPNRQKMIPAATTSLFSLLYIRRIDDLQYLQSLPEEIKTRYFQTVCG